MEYVYLEWQRTAANVAKYAEILAEYDPEGSIVAQERQNNWVKDSDCEKDQSGDYVTESDGKIVLLSGKFERTITEAEKAGFDELENSGALDGWSYVKKQSSEIQAYMETMVLRSPYWFPWEGA